jgi:radical SAM superfamily enzyme YgiQ (UPF0313 family)
MRMTMVLLEIRSKLPGFSGYYSEGVGSIAAQVKQAGHDFRLFHITRPTDPDKLARQLAVTRPDLVGFSCMTHTFSYLKAFVRAVKQVLPGVPTLMGGVHAILNPEESIQVDGLDAVCLGEGEAVMPAVMQRVEDRRPLDDVLGLWVKSGGRIIRNANAPLVEDLTALAPPDRSVFDFERLVSTRESVLYVFASRGCQYKCPFCSNEAIRDQFPNSKSYLRYKSVERVCEEIESARRYFPKGLLGIYFQDEILTMKKSWFVRFAEIYPRRIGVPFNCNLRADLISENTADLLKKSGCTSVSLGLESGVESIRGAVVGKPISDAECHRAFQRLRDRGIRTNTFNMVGLPGETPDDALDTAFFNAEAKIDKSMVSIFCPYPGTPLYKRALADGILSDNMPDTYSDDTPLVQSSISPSQVRFIHDYFGLIIRLVRARWPGGALKEPLRRLVRHDGWGLRALVAAKRMAKYLLTGPYLTLGRLFFNRQEKVFQEGLVPCDGLTGAKASVVHQQTRDLPRPAQWRDKELETMEI